MNSVELAQWYYLIYLVPGGIAMLLLLAAAAGGHHHHGGHGHHGGLRLHHGHGPSGGGHSHGPAAAHTAQHHATGVKHGGAPHSNSVKHGGTRSLQGDSRASGNLGTHLMGFFGFGRVPGPFVWGSLLLGWGICGFWATRLLEPAMHYPALFALPALGAAAVGALVIMRLAVSVGSKLLPEEASTAISTIELCGQTGTVAFPVDDTRGRVHVYDAYGTMHDVTARVSPGHGVIGRGRRVLVMDYDAQRQQVIVEEIA